MNSHGNSTHGRTNTKEYRSWRGAKYRCTNVSNKAFSRYGGRGIKVCDRWLHSFENFLEDMGESPSPEHSLDRIDNDGDYSPGNCRWATRVEQARNKRDNRLVEVNGDQKTIAEWSEITGIKHVTIKHRLNRGWTPERAVGVFS